jgi:hypothetical protein
MDSQNPPEGETGGGRESLRAAIRFGLRVRAARARPNEFSHESAPNFP